MGSASPDRHLHPAVQPWPEVRGPHQGDPERVGEQAVLEPRVVALPRREDGDARGPRDPRRCRRLQPRPQQRHGVERVGRATGGEQRRQRAAQALPVRQRVAEAGGTRRWSLATTHEPSEVRSTSARHRRRGCPATPGRPRPGPVPGCAPRPSRAARRHAPPAARGRRRPAVVRPPGRPRPGRRSAPDGAARPRQPARPPRPRERCAEPVQRQRANRLPAVGPRAHGDPGLGASAAILRGGAQPRQPEPRSPGDRRRR